MCETSRVAGPLLGNPKRREQYGIFGHPRWKHVTLLERRGKNVVDRRIFGSDSTLIKQTSYEFSNKNIKRVLESKLNSIAIPQASVRSTLESKWIPK